MRTAEAITLTYLTYLLVVAAVRALRLTARRRLLIGTAATGTIIAVMAIPPENVITTAIRDWMPAAYILAGYWFSGTFFETPNENIERAFQRTDQRLFVSADVDRRIEAAPRIFLEYLELAYLTCYALVPAGFAWLFFMAGPDSGERFWSIVLPAVLGSYAMLPWVPTRPPRAIEPPGAMDRRALRVRHLNLWVLKHASIQANTVPSGHVAGAFATALALAASAPIAATVFGTIALSIAAASVLGRYHYLTDAWLGLLVAVATWAVMG